MMRAVLIAALLAGTPSQDDAFCDALKRIVASAPGDFRDVRGPLVERVNDSWEAGVSPVLDAPRQAHCRVSPDDWRDMKAISWQYGCFTYYETDAEAPTDATVAVLADRAAKCFGATVWTLRNNERVELGYPAERRIPVGQFEIVVVASRMEHIIIMDGPYRPPEPYLGDSTPHDFWLTLTLRKRDPQRYGN